MDRGSSPAPAPAEAVADAAPSPIAAAVAAAGIAESPAAVIPETAQAVPPPAATRAVAAPDTPRAHSLGLASAPAEPGLFERLAGAVKTWFTTGNVPVKVGVVVLFLGVGALLKYAAEQGWMRFPIELRLAGIALAAIAALGFAWRQRHRRRAFALALQGGAVGVLILTVFAAFAYYHLLAAPVAFALLLVLVAGTGLLAVLQDALALAVLGCVGGFLAPILVSTGQEAHVALFSYYALLNAAVFAIAWFKAWRPLNLVGFGFTFAVASAWGALQYRPEFFASTEPFLLLFAAFYLAIPVLYALRHPPQGRERFVDGTLVFGMPLLAFPLQVGLLHGDRLGLAYSALVAAVIYALLAWREMRREDLRLLGQSHAVLALGFATLAVPLGLSARSTACTWALEGAALVWLGLRQSRRFPRYVGYALQGAAGCAALAALGDRRIPAYPVLNGDFLGLALLAAAGLVTSRLLYRRSATAPLPVLFFAWALLWWMLAGTHEIVTHASVATQPSWALAAIAASALFFAELGAALAWPFCSVPALLAFPLALPLTLTVRDHGPLEGHAALAWALWLACSLRILARRGADLPRLALAAQALMLTSITVLLAGETHHAGAAHLGLPPLWRTLATLAVPLAMYWLILRRAAALRYPLGTAAEIWRIPALSALALVLGIAAILGLFVEGDPRPLAYLPLFNPLELAQVLVLLSLMAWYRLAHAEGGTLFEERQRAPLLALAGVALLTAVTVRSVHFYADVPWNAALFESILVQAALSVVWSLAGLLAMLLGARRGSRPVWIGGAVLMAVVLGKLALVDRHHLGDLAGIVSFLAVGMLLLVVGYFAPVPPRTATPEERP
jgi:uncharacterized membrane protein